MKFGKKLFEHLDPSQVHHCIAYDVLTKAINVVVAAYGPNKDGGAQDLQDDMDAVDEVFGTSTQTLSKPGCQPPDSRFHTLLQHELEKVNRFYALQLRTLLDTLNEAQRELAQLDNEPAISPEGGGHAAAAERLLDAAGSELVALERFRRLNFTGFRKIAKKFDKKMREARAQSGSLSAWFLPQLFRERFCVNPLEPHLLALSWGWAALRRRVRSNSAESAADPRAHGASTTFWLHPSARMRALCTLVKRFEIVLGPTTAADDKQDDAATLVEQQRRLLHSMSPDGSARVPCEVFTHIATTHSTTYYDGPEFPEYMARLRQGEPTGFRVRRSQVESGASSTAVDTLVEREGATSALNEHAITALDSLKSPDGFPIATPGDEGLPSAKVLREAATAALAAAPQQPGFSSEQKQQLALFAKEVASASEGDVTPVATVALQRVLLRGNSGSTKGVCVAVDENVQFSSGPARPVDEAASDALDFPYSLLEVAGIPSDSTSTWLSELVGSGMVKKVARFSLGAQAVAALYKDKLPELPSWFQQLVIAESSQPPEAWGLMLEWRTAMHQSDKGNAGAQVAVGVPPAPQPPAPPPPQPLPAEPQPQPAPPADSMDGVELRPKDFMACERTMLEWMHTVVALAFLGYGLWRRSLQASAREPGTLAVGLLDVSEPRRLALGAYGLALLGLALLFGWHAVGTHLRRVRALVKKDLAEPLFNSRRAPVLFALLLGCAMTVHLAVQALPLWRALVG